MPEILSYKPDLEMQTDRHKLTALHISVIQGHEVLTKALSDAGANLSARTPHSKSILDLARTDKMRQLVEDIVYDKLDFCCVRYETELEKPIISFPCAAGESHSEKVCENCLDNLVICSICRGKFLKK